MKGKDIISKFINAGLKVTRVRGKLIRKGKRRPFLIGAGFAFRPWDDNLLTKMQARHLIKWFLGHKYDPNRLPFSNVKRNKIRTKKALRNTIIHGINDNLSALKLLDDYRLLDKRNAKRKRKPHLKSRWTNEQIYEEFLEPWRDTVSTKASHYKSTIGKIRTLLKKIERLEDKLGIKRKRRRE